MRTMTEPLAGDPRATIPSTYVVCSQDAAVHPDHQRVMSARCSTQVTFATDHSPFISAVEDLADVVAGAAAS